MVIPDDRAPRLAVLDGVVVTAAGIEAFDCPVCGDTRDLVVPDDDLPADAGPSPARACAECGFALVVGLPAWIADDQTPARRATTARSETRTPRTARPARRGRTA